VQSIACHDAYITSPTVLQNGYCNIQNNAYSRVREIVAGSDREPKCGRSTAAKFGVHDRKGITGYMHYITRKYIYCDMSSL
jgi:hypothetical protein